MRDDGMVKRITNLVANAQRHIGTHIRRQAPDSQWRFSSFCVAASAHSCENFHKFKCIHCTFVSFDTKYVFIFFFIFLRYLSYL